LIRLSYKKDEVYISAEIPKELRDLSKPVAYVFLQILDFIKKKGISLYECFAIFDIKKTGKVQKDQFIDLLNEVASD
jgi:hypothetical protein